ncbi:MAG: hypothetical protein U0802_08310 [Candidatus Binatia bacterium]
MVRGDITHTVGPVYRDGRHGEGGPPGQRLPAQPRGRQRARRADAQPFSISTGAYGYPVGAAARIAIGTVRAYLLRATRDRPRRFVLFSDADLAAYEEALGGD